MKTLTPRHYKAIELYCNPDSESFGNMLRSYLGAGFKDNKGANRCACRFFADAQISTEVRSKQREYEQKIEQKCSFDDNFIRSQWLQLLEDCKEETIDEQGLTTAKYVDRTNANSVLRTMAMSRAMLTDKYQDASVDNVPKLAGDDLKYYKAMANQYIKSRTMAEKVPGLRSNALKLNKGITDGQDEKTA